MYHAEKVKIDVDYVNRYLERAGISNSDFSAMNGHGRSWWTSIANRCDSKVAVNQAKLICTLTGLDYEKLVIPEKPITSSTNTQNEQKNIREVDENLLMALVNCLNRIETKVNESAMNMNRLEIQMRTVLKELGGK